MVASVGETGDLLDVRLRKGAVHTAEGGLGFIVGVLDRAERFLCELMSVVNPALSSSPRPKRHYRGRAVEKPGPGIDAFACNEARLLLAVFGYQIMHAQRAVLERATGTGWSLRRLLERVLRAPARFTVSGRRIAMIASAALAALASPGPPAPAPARTRGVAFRDRRGSEGGGRRGIRVPGTGIRWPYRRIESRKPLQNGVLGAHLGVR